MSFELLSEVVYFDAADLGDVVGLRFVMKVLKMFVGYLFPGRIVSVEIEDLLQ